MILVFPLLLARFGWFQIFPSFLVLFRCFWLRIVVNFKRSLKVLYVLEIVCKRLAEVPREGVKLHSGKCALIKLNVRGFNIPRRRALKSETFI